MTDARLFAAISQAAAKAGTSRLSWLKKQMQARRHGGCRECEAKSLPGHTRCARHLLKTRHYHRRTRRFSPWQKGSRGRPVRYSDVDLAYLEVVQR